MCKGVKPFLSAVIYYNSISSFVLIILYWFSSAFKLFIISIIVVNIVIFEYKCAPIVSKNNDNDNNNI